jgi:hypothetical protein
VGPRGIEPRTRGLEGDRNAHHLASTSDFKHVLGYKNSSDRTTRLGFAPRMDPRRLRIPQRSPDPPRATPRGERVVSYESSVGRCERLLNEQAYPIASFARRTYPVSRVRKKHRALLLNSRRSVFVSTQYRERVGVSRQTVITWRGRRPTSFDHRRTGPERSARRSVNNGAYAIYGARPDG